MSTTRTSTTHFIAPGQLLLSPNALGNPDLIQSTISGDATVIIVDGEHFPLDELEQWPTFKLASKDIKLNGGDGEYNIYLCVPTPKNVSAPNTATIGYSVYTLDIDGYVERGSVGTVGTRIGTDSYKYYIIGKVGAKGSDDTASATPKGQGRSLTLDLGVTPPATNVPSTVFDLDKLFQISKPSPKNPATWLVTILGTIASMRAAVLRIADRIIFGEGDSEVEIAGVNTSTAEDAPLDDTHLITAAWAVRSFLRKDIDEHTDYSLSVGGGLISDTLRSNLFESGDFGCGYKLFVDESGASELEVDRVVVRREAVFNELTIKKMNHIGGELVLSPASMKCTEVEELDGVYRCYFINEANGDRIFNEFKAGDQARLQTFKAQEGTASMVSSRYYWGCVVAVGDNYIDLSKTDCDRGSVAPRSGDDIVQLGNRIDTRRQSAIILSTIGDDAPSIKQYDGIDSFNLTGKCTHKISPKGNFFKGDFQSSSGRDIDSVLDVIEADLSSVKEQTDKQYVIWFFDHTPTLSNEPASEWNSDSKRAEHVEDLMYDRNSGFAYRFTETDGVYEWQAIADQQTIKALEAASKAQDTADGKRRTFVYQPTDNDSYDEGDLWVNATWKKDGMEYDNDALRCVVGKTAGTPFSISHWKPINSTTTNSVKASIKNLGDSLRMEVEETMSDGRHIVSSINQTSSNIQIKAEKVDIAGSVSFRNLQTEVDNKVDSSTIIEGGKIKTSLIDADKVLTDDLVSKKVSAVNIVTEKLTAKKGCVVGGKVISESGITLGAEINFSPVYWISSYGFNNTSQVANLFYHSNTFYLSTLRFADQSAGRLRVKLPSFSDMASIVQGEFGQDAAGHGFSLQFVCPWRSPLISSGVNPGAFGDSEMVDNIDTFTLECSDTKDKIISPSGSAISSIEMKKGNIVELFGVICGGINATLHIEYYIKYSNV